ncbi:MAG TPA: hypothetical protein PKC28_04790 [Bdellovibrionales bacterium]|nr:hypothetical protein [Bdellovibrionales bacterium]
MGAPTLKPNLIALTEDLRPSEVLHLVLQGGVRHVCQSKGAAFDQEKLSAETLIQTPERFFEFPVASVFAPLSPSPETERSFTWAEERFDSSAQKRAVLDSFGKTMKSKGLSQTLVDDVVLVADEMFTNAIFNAPFVDQKTHVNPGVSRLDLDVQLERGKFGRLILAEHAGRLLVGCEDPYGSLSLPMCLHKIKATYDRGVAESMNFGSGGSGIGSYIIYNTGSSLYLGVNPGLKTTLCCVIPHGMGNKRRAQMPKNLHCIQL